MGRGTRGGSIDLSTVERHAYRLSDSRLISRNEGRWMIEGSMRDQGMYEAPRGSAGNCESAAFPIVGRSTNITTNTASRVAFA